MANIIPSSYLPVASQPWGREIQKRLESLESNFSLQKTNTNTVDSQLQSSYKRLDETVRSLGTINVDIANITTISNQAVAIANNAIAGLNSLGSINSPYTVNGDNITGTFLPTEPVVNGETARSAGYIGLPQISLDSGALTLNKSHAGRQIYLTATSQTVTIPANSSVPFEIGSVVVIVNGNFTNFIAINNDTLRLAGTANTGTRTLGPWGFATLVKIDFTTWVVYGNGLT
jgi:hypothetical protein